MYKYRRSGVGREAVFKVSGLHHGKWQLKRYPHFYPKSIFQLFSLSLYNFVPSCQICNSRCKGDKKLQILYPYRDTKQDEIMFDIELQEHATVDSLIGREKKFEIKVKLADEHAENKEIIENTIDMFKLEGLYSSHKDYVNELLYKKYSRVIR